MARPERTAALLALLAFLLALTPALGACSAGGAALGTTSSVSVSSSQAPGTTVAPDEAASSTTVAPDEAASSTTSIPAVSGPEAAPVMVFAVIGDYGVNNEHEAAVARLVASWDPTFIITTGDDYYTPAGGTGTGKYDESTGAYYGPWLKDITTTGTRYPKGLAPVNAFFPCLGNHDYSSATPGPQTYLTYFDLPGAGFANTSGNERYYDFVEGPIHFFALNSNQQEPDGTTSTSKQARWLETQLAASTSTWNVVYDHHPPYCSDLFHGSTGYMQWPFGQWGADVMLSGHAHAYERVDRNGIVYFVNGLGGAPRYIFGFSVMGSMVRYNADWGAQKVTVTQHDLVFQFYNTAGRLIDTYQVPARP